MQNITHKNNPDYDIKSEAGVTAAKIIIRIRHGTKEEVIKASLELADIILSYLRLKNAAGN